MGYRWVTENSLQLITTNAMIDLQLTTPHKTKYLQYFISTPKPIYNTTGFPYTHGNHLPSYGMAPETQPDHTEHHLTAILLIASIFVFLTLGILGTFFVFYKKKNTVFALQKCEEDSDDNNFELDDLDLTQISFSDTESVQDIENMGMRRSNTCSDMKVENETGQNIPRAKTISNIKDVSTKKSSKKKRKERRNPSTKSSQYKPLIVTAVLEGKNNLIEERQKSDGCLNSDLKMLSEHSIECATGNKYKKLKTECQNKDNRKQSEAKDSSLDFHEVYISPAIQHDVFPSKPDNLYAMGSDYNIYQEDNTFQQISGKLSIDVHSILPDKPSDSQVTRDCGADPESEHLLMPHAERGANVSSLPLRFYQPRNFFENSNC